MNDASSWNGFRASDLAGLLDLPHVIALESTSSTMDLAHASAAHGVTRGLLVVAEAQEAGRGRAGRSWSSAPGAGVWATMIEKPIDRASVDVLSIRVGLLLAESLSALARVEAQMKWPNDVMLEGRKLAGVLAEASWAGAELNYVAIGVGVNVATPPGLNAIGIGPIDRLSVLRSVVASIRNAASARGHLTGDELARYRGRDMLRGRRIRLPAPGIVRGISPDGALLVDAAGDVQSHRSGTIVLAEDP